jgi:hypothetical protein
MGKLSNDLYGVSFLKASEASSEEKPPSINTRLDATTAHRPQIWSKNYNFKNKLNLLGPKTQPESNS